MLFDMVCNCGAAIQLDNDEPSSAVWLLVQRFTDAHVSCGFMTPVKTDEPEKTRKAKFNTNEPKENR